MQSQPVEVKEGNKIQFGASSRVFVLHGSKGGATAGTSGHPPTSGDMNFINTSLFRARADSKILILHDCLPSKSD